MRLLTYIVMTYMLLALFWWTVLLSRNNTELFQKSIQLEAYTSQQSGNGTNFDSDAITEIRTIYERKANMILGEGIVFGIILVIGLWLMQRSFQKELRTAENQRNFLLSVTHELKTPLAGIHLILQTLKKRKLDAVQQSELIEDALTENQRLENLINNILISTKLSSKYDFHFEPADVSEIIDVYTQKFKRIHPDVTIHYQIDQPVILPVDREAFIILLSNLVENALKYSDKTPEISIRHYRSEQHTELSVSDNGVGIPDKEKKNIFRQFYRLENEDTRKNKGTGLGLYIVYKIVRAHSGTIQVVDNIPHGSTFIIKLPNHQKQLS
jgi:signal transduction histidine kinase